MSDVIPCFSEDVWFEILKNLPVKTVGKCRCVCKSWHSLIVSPSFITAHLKCYTQNDKNTLLLYREMTTKIPEFQLYRFFLDSGCIPLQLSHTSICPFKEQVTYKQCSFIVGSIHGLLCLSDRCYLGPTSQIMLWNPFLRKMINLPMSLAATNDLGGLKSVLGFGYDSNKNDHRVVKISNSRCKYEFVPLVEVYSVSKRIWKTIPSIPADDYLIYNPISRISYSPCFFNGVIHWLAWEIGLCLSYFKWVLTFNVVEETFQKIKLPESLVNMRRGTLGISEYKTKLSVSYYEHNPLDRFIFANCQVWVKEEESSWCMILNVTVEHYWLASPLEYIGRDFKLFGLASGGSMLLFYDDVKRQFIKLGIYHDVSARFATFTDSLVLLDQDTDVYSNDELQRALQDQSRPFCLADMSLSEKYHVNSVNMAK